MSAALLRLTVLLMFFVASHASVSDQELKDLGNDLVDSNGGSSYRKRFYRVIPGFDQKSNQLFVEHSGPCMDSCRAHVDDCEKLKDCLKTSKICSADSQAQEFISEREKTGDVCNQLINSYCYMTLGLYMGFDKVAKRTGKQTCFDLPSGNWECKDFEKNEGCFKDATKPVLGDKCDPFYNAAKKAYCSKEEFNGQDLLNAKSARQTVSLLPAVSALAIAAALHF